MGLETTFYIIGIVSMVLWIIIAITCIVMVFYLKHQVKLLQSSIVGRIAGLLRNKKAEVATAVGLTVVQAVLNRFKKKSSNA